MTKAHGKKIGKKVGKKVAKKIGCRCPVGKEVAWDKAGGY